MPDAHLRGSPDSPSSGVYGLPAALLLHYCHWRSSGRKAVPASGSLRITQAESSPDRKPQLTCRQEELGATLVLYLSPANLLPQSPKESGPVGVSTVNRPVGLIGTLANYNFLFGFRQFGHTFSLRKVGALRGTQRP